jgi:hypothetical protein
LHQINWWNIRSYDNSQNNAFEELVCQLAREEFIPNKISFIRVGAPDGGVEAYCTLNNGDEYGWQAKFFDTMGDSQWKQIEKSFKTAFEKHQNLVKYYICIPLDRQDPRIENQKWFMDKWNTYTKEWSEFASDHQRNVVFEYWGSSELISILSQEKHAGRFRFWFERDFLSENWFRDKLQVNIDSLGNRYTPKLNFELEIAKIFDGISRDCAFREQLDSVYNFFAKKLTSAINHLNHDGLHDLRETIIKISSEFQKILSDLNILEMEYIDFKTLTDNCKLLDELLWACIDKYQEMLNQVEEDSKKTYESHKLTSQVKDIKQAVRYLSKRQTLPTFESNNRYEIILLRSQSEEVFLWEEKTFERNGKLVFRHSVQAAKRQRIGVKPIRLIVDNFTHGSRGWTRRHLLHELNRRNSFLCK